MALLYYICFKWFNLGLRNELYIKDKQLQYPYCGGNLNFRTGWFWKQTAFWWGLISSYIVADSAFSTLNLHCCISFILIWCYTSLRIGDQTTRFVTSLALTIFAYMSSFPLKNMTKHLQYCYFLRLMFLSYLFRNLYFISLWTCVHLTYSHTMTPFDAPGKQAFWKHCGKRRNCS